MLPSSLAHELRRLVTERYVVGNEDVAGFRGAFEEVDADQGGTPTRLVALRPVQPLEVSCSRTSGCCCV